MHRKQPGQTARGPAYGRMRASRTCDREREIERRLAGFGLPRGRRRGEAPDPGLGSRIGRALRAERRAARAGGLGYDLLRHLVLVRAERVLSGRRTDRMLVSGRRLARRRREH